MLNLDEFGFFLVFLYFFHPVPHGFAMIYMALHADLRTEGAWTTTHVLSKDCPKLSKSVSGRHFSRILKNSQEFSRYI